MKADRLEEDSYAVVFGDGDEAMAGLRGFAAETRFSAASFTAIGPPMENSNAPPTIGPLQGLGVTRTPSVVPPAPSCPLPGVRGALTGTHPIGRPHSDPRLLVKHAFAGFDNGNDRRSFAVAAASWPLARYEPTNQEDPPMKPLSEQLTDLAARAKKTEDFVASAEESNRKQLEQDRADLKAAVAAGKANAQQDAATVKQETSQAWDEVGSSVDHWLDKVRAAANERRSERNIKRAQRDAEVSEDVAAGAIDFAIFALDQAEYAVTDAVLARADADAMAASG